jgi:hypothetical protein
LKILKISDKFANFKIYSVEKRKVADRPSFVAPTRPTKQKKVGNSKKFSSLLQATTYNKTINNNNFVL